MYTSEVRDNLKYKLSEQDKLKRDKRILAGVVIGAVLIGIGLVFYEFYLTIELITVIHG